LAEVTTVSMGVDYEIGRAVESGKKVLCLFRPDSGKNLSPMVGGCSYITLFEYSLLKEAKSAISQFLDK